MCPASVEPPEDSVHWLLKPDPWWESVPAGPIERGRLIRTFIPHVDQEPYVLVLEGRSDAQAHDRATYRVEPLNIKSAYRKSKIPIAGMPHVPGESRVVYRGKVRPALVLGTGGAEVPRSLAPSSARWLTAKTLLVAPYYGADQNGSRGGWPPAFVTRIRRAEYPQYVWDSLPLRGANESILRLDQVQAIGRDSKAIEVLPYRLHPSALRIVDEWLTWLRDGTLPADSLVRLLRESLMAL